MEDMTDKEGELSFRHILFQYNFSFCHLRIDGKGQKKTIFSTNFPLRKKPALLLTRHLESQISSLLISM